MRNTWEEADCFFIRAWKCRKCGSLLYDRKRTDQREYATVKKVVCRQCKRRCKIIVENEPLPETGDDEL